MQISILNGIYTDGAADFGVTYPVNLIPVPREQGISKGYLRPAYGIVQDGAGPGASRGSIMWNGTCYRVMGSKLCSVAADGVVTTLGDVGAGGQVTLDYSFDRLAIASGGRLYYWDGALTQVTDGDLGAVVDFCWVDGYFFTTDGTYLVVTELNDPYAVNPLKYGSSEADPDPVNAIVKIHNEVYAVNRHTIEVFNNVGGVGFAFERIEGAQIQKGAIGTHCATQFLDGCAFLGGGRNEPPAVYLGANASTAKLSTGEIDRLLKNYTEAELTTSVLEAVVDEAHQFLYLHLPDRTLVYDAAASVKMEQPVWFYLTDGVAGFNQYPAKDFVWGYDQWLAGNPVDGRVGHYDDTLSSYWGSIVRWEFGTSALYNGGYGAIVHQLELVALPGRVQFGDDPMISTSYSLDGLTWSMDKSVSAGKQGAYDKRLVWMQQGMMRNWRVQRFRGDSQAFISFARLEAQVEALRA